MTRPTRARCCWVLALVLLGSGRATADTEVMTESLQLTFSETGTLKSAVACLPACDAQTTRTRRFGGTGDVLGFERSTARQPRLERLETELETVLTFYGADGTPGSVWHIPRQGWTIRLRLEEPAGLRLRSGEAFRPPPSAGFGTLLERLRYTWQSEDGVGGAELDAEETTRLTSANWFGFRLRFWAALMAADRPLVAELQSAPQQQEAEIRVASPDAGPLLVRVYLGPVESASLASADAELTELMYASLWYPLRLICRGLYLLLDAIYALVPHWGAAIMLLSLAVGFLMRPLTRIADRLQDEVHRTEARLAPELQEIKRRFKGETQAEKILAMYRQHGVHPLYSLKSLAGVMVVIPIFIGAFDMLAENVWLSGASFVWIEDLARPDSIFTLPFRLFFLGDQFNLLPFLMTGLSVTASYLHQHEALTPELQRRQARKLLLMALAFLLLFYTFPAGMVLYWTTNNLISATRNLRARRRDAARPQPEENKP